MSLELNPPVQAASPQDDDPPTPLLLYSPKQTAEALGWSKSKLYALWKDDPANAPPSFIIGGNRYVSISALHQWIEERGGVATVVSH